MSSPTTVMSPSETYRITKFLGRGGSSVVLQGVEESSGNIVAVKKVRISQRVKRPILQYESQVHELLQGHPAIPALYGYIRRPHFEYLAMELLGLSIRQLVKGPVSVTTSASVTQQMLSALEHVHGHGFVHRDIKPENILLSLEDPSKLKLIDLGIARPFARGVPFKYDPLLEKKYIVGTLNWASLNSHNGVALAPRDDLESLAYISFYLLRGTLPWRRSLAAPSEPYLKSLRRVTAVKTAASSELGAGFPAEFGYLLSYSRKLEYNQTPDYEALMGRFVGIGGECVGGPLDWSVVEVSITEKDDKPKADGRDDEESDEEDDLQEAEDEDSSRENYSDSYFEMDIDMYDLQSARDRSMTLPTEQAELAASRTPEIGIIESE